MYQDGAVYAVTCTGCGASAMTVEHTAQPNSRGEFYQTTITCTRCGAAIISVLWSEAGQWYTSGRSQPGPDLPQAAQ